VEEFHGQLKIGGGKKRVLLDWRENGKRRNKKNDSKYMGVFSEYSGFLNH
jgi:hypothetical protein